MKRISLMFAVLLVMSACGTGGTATTTTAGAARTGDVGPVGLFASSLSQFDQCDGRPQVDGSRCRVAVARFSVAPAALPRAAIGRSRRPQLRKQALAVDVAHREPRLAVVLAGDVRRADVGVIDLRCCRDFAAKAVAVVRTHLSRAIVRLGGELEKLGVRG